MPCPCSMIQYDTLWCDAITTGSSSEPYKKKCCRSNAVVRVSRLTQRTSSRGIDSCMVNVHHTISSSFLGHYCRRLYNMIGVYRVHTAVYTPKYNGTRIYNIIRCLIPPKHSSSYCRFVLNTHTAVTSVRWHRYIMHFAYHTKPGSFINCLL